MEKVSMETIVSLAKRRGFVFPGSEIYGGLAGTFDYGHYGVLLKENIKQLWWKMFVDEHTNMYRVDAAILMNPKIWEASGHVAGFSDPLVEDAKTKKRYRADHLIEQFMQDHPELGTIAFEASNPDAVNSVIREYKITSPDGNPLGPVRTFNMMFKTYIGATEDDASVSYLRPETAAGMFVNFKNTIDAFHPKLPFGLAQIGKAFRNEIAPRDFIFRLRELEQMEVEYFVREDEWKDSFEKWRTTMLAFADTLGLEKSSVHELEVEQKDLAHYSKRTIDFEFDYPFGRKELWGLAYRTNFDLSAHQAGSTTSLEYLDEEAKERIVPHVIEPSLGVDRTFLAVLLAAYDEDELGGEKRVVLRFHPRIAPVKAMVSPLLKNKPELVEKAQEVFALLRKVHPAISWDDNGNIGKRYRRQDEIGTPWCVTIDFDTLGENPELKDTVTIRDRDTGAQERLTITEVAERIKNALA